MNSYIEKVYKNVLERNKHEEEYIQSVEKFLKCVTPYVLLHDEIKKYNILERILEPDRIIIFNVPWVNDSNEVVINRGFRVQHNNCVGPYKGGLRFDKSVNLSIVKFLGFSQTLKNALTTLPLGGAKGGSDFEPKGKSEFEIMRFTQSFANELYKYIGPDIDIPAGDLGCGGREVNYIYGQYKKLTNLFNGTITGKNIHNGGIKGRSEATGYGLVYYTNKMLDVVRNESIENKKVIISGCGNVGLYTFEKVNQLKGKVIAISDSKGFIYNENGLNYNIFKKIKDKNLPLTEYLNHDQKATYTTDPKNMWKIPCEVCLPCATQNEIDLDDCISLVENGCYCLSEGANMPVTNEGVEYLISKNVLYGPGISSNCGGVMVSGFEMSQNSNRINWTFEECDNELKKTIEKIFLSVYDVTLRYCENLDFGKGAYIKAFEMVSKAMISTGI